MTETKFSKGPFRIDEWNGARWIQDADGTTVCDLYSRDRCAEGKVSMHPFPNAENNAPLLKAAPEMYEAINKAMAAWNPITIHENHVFTMLLNARDKARGTS